MPQLITILECPDTQERLMHNRDAIKYDHIAINAMLEVRQERLNAIHKQDMNCLRKMRNK